MWTRCLTVLLALLPVCAVAGEAYVASPWQKAQSSDVRLIASLPDAPPVGGWRYGAVEIRLPPDAKTYWRTAGETGVPPTFTFDGSRGVREIEVQFPAPVAFDDGIGGVAYGYIGAALFPVRFKAEDAAGYTLAVNVDYGVCLKTMCVPAQAKLSLSPGGVADAGLAVRVADVRGRVPKTVGMNDAGPLSVTAVTATREKDGLTLAVSVRSAAKEAPSVFVEGGEAFTPGGSAPDGEATRYLFRAQRAASAAPWGDARITVVAGPVATETTVNIDAAIPR